jgi:hypothetical protein
MQLPYLEHQVSAPITDTVNALLNGAQKEMELVASQCFYDEEDDDAGETFFTVSQEYTGYFKKTAEEISAVLGQPVFQGQQPAAMEWTEIVDADANLDEIAIWEQDGHYVYLQKIWEDKDCPIVILLGKAKKQSA